MTRYEGMLGQGTTVLVEIQTNKGIPDRLAAGAIVRDDGDRRLRPTTRYVKVRIEEPLRLEIIGENFGRLLDCKCKIESLNQEADSVNHAYTLISTAFEPERKSHTGNVFSKVFVQRHDKKWVTLDALRQTILCGV